MPGLPIGEKEYYCPFCDKDRTDSASSPFRCVCGERLLVISRTGLSTEQIDKLRASLKETYDVDGAIGVYKFTVNPNIEVIDSQRSLAVEPRKPTEDNNYKKSLYEDFLMGTLKRFRPSIGNVAFVLSLVAAAFVFSVKHGWLLPNWLAPKTLSSCESSRRSGGIDAPDPSCAASAEGYISDDVLISNCQKRVRDFFDGPAPDFYKNTVERRPRELSRVLMDARVRTSFFGDYRKLRFDCGIYDDSGTVVIILPLPN